MNESHGVHWYRLKLHFMLRKVKLIQALIEIYRKDLICIKPIVEGVVSDTPGLLPNLDQISRPIHLSLLITVWDQRGLSMTYFPQLFSI